MSYERLLALAAASAQRRQLQFQEEDREREEQEMARYEAMMQAAEEKQAKAEAAGKKSWTQKMMKGAQIGSAAGPWGALIGGIIGGAAGQYESYKQRRKEGQGGWTAFTDTMLDTPYIGNISKGIRTKGRDWKGDQKIGLEDIAGAASIYGMVKGGSKVGKYSQYAEQYKKSPYTSYGAYDEKGPTLGDVREYSAAMGKAGDYGQPVDLEGGRDYYYSSPYGAGEQAYDKYAEQQLAAGRPVVAESAYKSGKR